MKMHPKFGLAALAIGFLAAESAAASNWQLQAIDNHHGSSTYLARRVETVPTIAFTGHARITKTTVTTVKRTDTIPTEAKLIFRTVSTPHGTVSFFAPAE